MPEAQTQVELHKILDLVVRVDERQQSMSTKVDRIETAIFGNGHPGMRAHIEALDVRLNKVENKVDGLPIESMAQAIDDVEKELDLVNARHQAEDELFEEEKQDLKADRRELRKGYREFLWGLAGAAALYLINLILNSFGLSLIR